MGAIIPSLNYIYGDVEVYGGLRSSNLNIPPSGYAGIDAVYAADGATNLISYGARIVIGSTGKAMDLMFSTGVTFKWGVFEKFRVTQSDGVVIDNEPVGIKSYKQTAHAFVRIAESGGAISIGDSYGVTSLTDLGAGQYEVNLTTAASTSAAPLASADYQDYNATARMTATTIVSVQIKNSSTLALVDGSCSVVLFRSS